MKSKTCVTLFLFVAVMCFGSSVVFADTHYVDLGSPTPTYPYTSWNTASHTIGGGISAAASGDNVEVRAGTYTENIFGKSGVTIISEGDSTTTTYNDPWSSYSTTVLLRAAQTIIDGGGVGPVVTFDEFITANAVLNGFTVQNMDNIAINTDFPLIAITGGGSYSQVKNCIVRDNLGSGTNGGIGIRGRWLDPLEEFDTAPMIDSNFIHYVNGPGVGNGPYSHATIQNNEIWDSRGTDAPGIGLQGDTYPTIEYNTILENRRAGIGSFLNGLEAKAGTLTIPAIKGNTIQDNNAAGIALVRAAGDTGTINVTIGETGTGNGNDIDSNKYAGIFLDGITNTTIENNEIHSNGNAGVFLQTDFTQVTAHNNNIHDNTLAGILKQGAGTLTVTECQMDSNGTAGIYITGGGSNTIVGNDIDLNSAAGIRISAGSGTISQNNVYSNMSGISFGGSASPNYSIIKNNVYQNDTAGGIAIDPASSATPTFTIRQNKVYGQTNTSTGGGIQVVADSGSITIENNLAYENKRGGERFGPSTGIVRNNTVVGNGDSDNGGGIIFSTNKPPDIPEGTASAALIVENNISTHNEKAGTRVGGGSTGDPCPANADNRDYNLLYANYPWNDTQSRPNAADCLYPNLDISCTQQQYGGCGIDLLLWPPVKELASKNDVMADPEYVDMSGDDYHLEATSPAVTDPGADGSQRGCYGGAYPMNNLIDADTSTGNTPAGGTYVLFYLGASYDITDVRLYGSNTTQNWTVYVGADTVDCDGTWGTSGGTWSVGGAPGWYPYTLSTAPATGSYIKLTSTDALGENEVFEFQFKEDGGSYWRTPSIVVDSTCTDING